MIMAYLTSTVDYCFSGNSAAMYSEVGKLLIFITDLKSNA